MFIRFYIREMILTKGRPEDFQTKNKIQPVLPEWINSQSERTDCLNPQGVSLL